MKKAKKSSDVFCEGDSCGKKIPKTRLNALPDTKFCVSCAKDNEESISSDKYLSDIYDHQDLSDIVYPDE